MVNTKIFNDRREGGREGGRAKEGREGRER